MLKDITAVEFDLIFNFMRSLEFFRTAKGRMILYKIVVDQMQIDEPFPVFFLFFFQLFRTCNWKISLNCYFLKIIQ